MGFLDKWNPNLTESSFRVGHYRYPSPGARETYKKPKGEADKLSKNYYYNRDVRRNYPRTLIFTQQDVSRFIENKTSITDVDENLKNTVSLSDALKKYTSDHNSDEKFLPPFPNKPYRYQVSPDTYNMPPGMYWPTYLVK